MLALSGQFPLAKIGRRAAFIKFDEIEARPAPPVQPPEARLLKQGSEALTRGVAPASLRMKPSKISISPSLGRRPLAKHHSRTSSSDPPAITRSRKSAYLTRRKARQCPSNSRPRSL